MGNRILKESIRSSKSINAMTDFQFRVWTYLITYVDDYGRGSADPELLKGFVFPRRKKVTESQISKALNEIADMGCIILYESDGENYFYFPNWSDHQRIQTKKSKFPEPQKSTVNHREPPPEYESNTNTNTNTNPEYEDILHEASSAPEAPPVISLTLNTGMEYEIYQPAVDEWQKLYPAVDVMQELRNMRGWCIGNKTRRKTQSGIERFINSWLSKEQNKGNAPRAAPIKTVDFAKIPSRADTHVEPDSLD